MAGPCSFSIHTGDHANISYSLAGPASAQPAPLARDPVQTTGTGKRAIRSLAGRQRLADLDRIIQLQSQRISELDTRAAALAAELAATKGFLQQKSQSQDLRDATVSSLTNSLAVQERVYAAAIAQHCMEVTALCSRAGSAHPAESTLQDELEQLRWQHKQDLDRLAAEKRGLASELDATSRQCQHLRVCLTERDELFVKNRKAANDFKSRARFLATIVHDFETGRPWPTPTALSLDFRLAAATAAAIASPTADRPEGGPDQISSLDPRDDHHGVPALLRLGMPALEGHLGLFGNFTPPLQRPSARAIPRPEPDRPGTLYDPALPALDPAGRCPPPRLDAPPPLLLDFPLDVAAVSATLTAISEFLALSAAAPAPDHEPGMGGSDFATTFDAVPQPSGPDGAASPADLGTAPFLPAPVYPDSPPPRPIERPRLQFPFWIPAPGPARSRSPDRLTGATYLHPATVARICQFRSGTLSPDPADSSSDEDVRARGHARP